MATYLKTQGFKELERDLLALANGEAIKLAKASLRQAIKPIVKRARENAPVKDGRLKKSIKGRVDTLRQGTDAGRVVSGLVYVSGKIGSRPRKTKRRSTVKGKLGPARYNYQIGSWPNVYGLFAEFGTSRQPARPWLRPAFDSQHNQALSILGDELGKRLEAAFATRGAKRGEAGWRTL